MHDADITASNSCRTSAAICHLAELPDPMNIRSMHGHRRLPTILLALWLAIGWPGSADAQPVVDLGIVATLTPPGPYAPGDVVQLQLTITNAEPETAPLVSAISNPYPFLDFELFSLLPGEPSPCQMFYDDFIAPPASGQPSFLVAQVVAGSLGPGQTRVCTIRLDVSPAASGEFDLEFAVINGEAGTTDTNSANNAATTSLLIVSATTAPAVIPATTVRSGLFLLLVVGAIGLLRSRSARW